MKRSIQIEDYFKILLWCNCFLSEVRIILMLILELKMAVGGGSSVGLTGRHDQWNFPILEIKKNGSGCIVLKTVHKNWSEHKVFVLWQYFFFSFHGFTPLFLLLLKMSIHWQHMLNTHKKHLSCIQYLPLILGQLKTGVASLRGTI